MKAPPYAKEKLVKVAKSHCCSRTMDENHHWEIGASVSARRAVKVQVQAVFIALVDLLDNVHLGTLL